MFAVLALTFSSFTLIVRALPLPNNIALFAAVGSPYAALTVVVALVWSLMHRRIVIAVVAVAIVAVNLIVQMPWYYFGKSPDVGAHVNVRVLSANLRLGRADVPSFVDLARASADVITLSEMTPDWLRRFYATGIRTEFPYSVLVPAVGAGGFGLWSRFPLDVVTPLKGGSMIAARVQVPGVRVDPVIASVHITNPLAFYGRSFGKWRSGITAAKVRMEGLADAAGPGAVIVAGDFNSTPDMRQFRDLLSNGYNDAVEQTGAGFAPTFPSVRLFPPLITIDHVITRNAATSSIRTISLRGSDHRSLLSTVDVPLDPISK
ncbi:hypothetical protein NGTWS1803_28570 [Mycolicibacterium cyprinidarum]|nr:hypothetical protein NGTWS1803_28570 [Mycolicibacterium sp. NGTWS1803]